VQELNATIILGGKPYLEVYKTCFNECLRQIINFECIK